jgi:hypothetical protein
VTGVLLLQRELYLVRTSKTWRMTRSYVNNEYTRHSNAAVAVLAKRKSEKNLLVPDLDALLKLKLGKRLFTRPSLRNGWRLRTHPKLNISRVGRQVTKNFSRRWVARISSRRLLSSAAKSRRNIHRSPFKYYSLFSLSRESIYKVCLDPNLVNLTSQSQVT